MNPLIPALAGLLSLAPTPADADLAGCPNLEYKPAGLEVLTMLDNAVWEAPEGVDPAEAMRGLGLTRVEFQCWNPETGRFGHRAAGLPIIRMFTGDRLEALECGIPETVMPAETPAWQKCDRADELASAAVREIWDAAVAAERARAPD